jgi:hypothetical protein
MPWAPAAGSALMIPSGSKPHLFVALNDPKTFAGYGAQPHVFLVNFTTVYPGIPYDTTCVFQNGVHPFIKHLSYVNYAGARFEPESNVITLAQKGIITPYPPDFSVQIVQLIKAGVATSSYTKNVFKGLSL